MKEHRNRRTYDQQCGLAFALDIVGERWTLLIIRELLVRPRRYRDLLDALPGIGTNLLADRLTFLTEAGIICSLDAERRTAGYALTMLGERLREPVLAMARFGLSVLAEHRGQLRGSVRRASWAALAIEAMVDPNRSTVDETYEFDVAGEVFHIQVENGRTQTRPGPAAATTLRIATDEQTFFDLGSGALDPVEALVSGAVTVTGHPAAVPRCLYLLGLGTGPADRPVPTAVGVGRVH
ncbi:winged helix-turn-helix transcriptional regulator [Micromonospora polyrhachis]|uniref:DNA-binding HxlR family transcriptional regulator/putative sterol carrier protein n=1 Tax=Micromonospora polyrhachis TaxID=1282883 RepID=A0A7W7WTB5_9ACTN|nr:helix-turn-helix domain-containing protein [Micromonospora polyrhachis]MBB4962522.1 DNA-binding HxlR family transcriptional regulator/putative sterol carrier protein [Micromonospora polyrhachis]